MCKFFFRIPIKEPDSGGLFITDPAGSGSYMEIFVTLENICYWIGTITFYEIWNFFLKFS
jgi:hypothetical protein